MERHQIILRNGSDEFDLFVRILIRHFIEILDERGFSFTDQWIVLDVMSADIQLDSFRRGAQIGCTIKINRIAFIHFTIIVHLPTP